MSTTNLFGQYYNKTIKKTTYQNVDYTCQSAGDGEYTLIFDDGQVKLIDKNGNVISSLDLGDVNAHPITEYKKGSIVINPGEVILIEGIEYGKLYKETYFQIPNVYISSLGDKYKYYFNVQFNILFNIDLELKEYVVKTTLSPDSKDGDIVSRIQKLLDAIGLEGKVIVSIEEGVDEYNKEMKFICFKSQIKGYDFIVTKFIFFNSTIIKSDVIDTYGVSSTTTKKLKETEDDITFRGGSSYLYNRGDALTNIEGELIGKYDEKDQPNNESHATHYYETPYSDEYEAELDESSEENPDDPEVPEIPTDSSDEEIIPDDIDNSEDEQVLDNVILAAMEFHANKVEDLEIPAFLYPNGAARAWFIVPDWPVGIQDDIVSLKLNHVKDQISIYTPKQIEEDGETNIYYKLENVNVYAAERNEVERHALQVFKYWIEDDNDTYIDGENGMAQEIVHEDIHIAPEGPDIHKEILNPHIGMYRYLDYVEMNHDWTNVGQFYGLVTAADTVQSLNKNLANSIFLYNENDFPIKVNYFICN